MSARLRSPALLVVAVKVLRGALHGEFPDITGEAYSALSGTLVRLRGGISRVKEALLHRVGKLGHAAAPRVAVGGFEAGDEIVRVSRHEGLVNVSLPDAVQDSLAVVVGRESRTPH